MTDAEARGVGEEHDGDGIAEPSGAGDPSSGEGVTEPNRDGDGHAGKIDEGESPPKADAGMVKDMALTIGGSSSWLLKHFQAFARIFQFLHGPPKWSHWCDVKMNSCDDTFTIRPTQALLLCMASPHEPSH